MGDSDESDVVSQSDLEVSLDYIKRAEVKLEEIDLLEDAGDSKMSDIPGKSVSASQECIELSVKAILKAAGVNPPTQHDINLDHERAAGVVSDPETPDDLYDDILRAIFMTCSWEPYYQPARYGFPELGVNPRDFIFEMDMDRAVEDADFCLNISKEFHEYQMEKYGYELSDLDIS